MGGGGAVCIRNQAREGLAIRFIQPGGSAELAATLLALLELKHLEQPCLFDTWKAGQPTHQLPAAVAVCY